MTETTNRKAYYPEAINFRAPKGTRAALRKRAAEMKTREADLLREVVVALVEDRITIQPPAERAKLYKGEA